MFIIFPFIPAFKVNADTYSDPRMAKKGKIWGFKNHIFYPKV